MNDDEEEKSLGDFIDELETVLWDTLTELETEGTFTTLNSFITTQQRKSGEYNVLKKK